MSFDSAYWKVLTELRDTQKEANMLWEANQVLVAREQMIRSHNNYLVGENGRLDEIITKLKDRLAQASLDCD